MEVGHRLGHEQAPETVGLGVATLEQHHASTTALLEGVVTVELLPRGPIESVEVTHRETLNGGVFAEIDEVLNQHAERRTPVPHVIASNDRMTHESIDPSEGVANHRGAQVADVHLFSDVRGRVVNDNRLGLRRHGYVQSLVGHQLVELLTKKRWRQREVEKSGTGHLDGGETGEVECGHQFVGYFSGWSAESLRQTHHAIDLIVRAIRGTQHGVTTQLQHIKGTLQASFEDFVRRGH